MAFSLFKKETKKPFLVFDIGNGSVGGALVVKDNMGERGELKIISSGRADIPIAENVDFETLFKSVLQAIDDLSPGLIKSKESADAPIFVILASPWYVSQTKIVNIKNERSFVFTKEFCNEIVSREVAEFEESLNGENAEKTGGGLGVIESQIIHTTLNGYETEKPFDKKVTEATIALYMGVSQKNITRGITQKLYTHFPHSKISFNSFPLAYFSAARDIFPEKNDFVLLDVSGEITDISLVRKGVLLETVSFPKGRNLIIRRVASELGRTAQEAQSLISLFTSGAIDEATKNKMNEIFSLIKKEWLLGFGKTLSGLSNDIYLPSEMFLTADDDMELIFSEWIKAEEFSQHVLSHEKFRVVSISKPLLSPIINPDGIKYDQFLNIGVLFADKIIGKNK